MADMFHGLGYATAIFGKWHLGGEPQSLPTAHGFDEFYGIPPDISLDSATYVDTIELTHKIDPPPGVLLAKGPQIVESVLGGPLHMVKPYTREVRAEIDNELTAKSIDFMKRSMPRASRSSTTCRSPWGISQIFRRKILRASRRLANTATN